MRMTMKALVAGGFLIFSASARAGWVSGGGEVVKDAGNPWFLANTKTVSYCIAVAPTGFPYDADETQPLIERAFAYWAGEFARARPMLPEARVASQRFTRVDCDANPNLEFQMGFMTAAQMKVVPNPQDYVSLAIRTSYDPVQLRGNGFVYVSAESGPFRPSSTHFMDHPWQDCGGCRLERVAFQ